MNASRRARVFAILAGTVLATALIGSVSAASSGAPTARSAAPAVVRPIWISKEAERPVVAPGDQVVFTITVRSSVPVTEGTITDPLDDRFAWSFSAASAGLACAIRDGVALECTFASLTEGEDLSVTLTGTPIPSEGGPFCGPVSNRATVEAHSLIDFPSDEALPSRVFDTDEATVEIACFLIQKVAYEETVDSGDTITFEITVSTGEFLEDVSSRTHCPTGSTGGSMICRGSLRATARSWTAR